MYAEVLRGALLETRQIFKPTLIVCPNASITVWLDELLRYCPGFRLWQYFTLDRKNHIPWKRLQHCCHYSSDMYFESSPSLVPPKSHLLPKKNPSPESFPLVDLPTELYLKISKLILVQGSFTKRKPKTSSSVPCRGCSESSYATRRGYCSKRSTGDKRR